MLDHAAILGSAPDGTYCQTLSFGRFSLVLFLEGNSAEESSKMGRELLTKIEDSAHQVPDASPEDLIKNYVAGIAARGNLNIAIAKIEKLQLQLALLGKVTAKIFRNGRIINLSSPTGSLSGPVSPNDLLVLATADFFTEFPATEIDSSLSPSEIKDQLAPQIETQDPQKTIAAVFVRVVQEEPLKEPEPLFAPAFKPDNRQPHLFSEKIIDIKTQKRKLLYLIFIFFLVVVSLITYQLRSRTLDQKLQTAASIEKVTREDLSSANKLLGLNDILARETLMRSKQNLLAKANTEFGENWQSKKDPAIIRVKNLLAELEKKITEVTHIYETGNLAVFSDLSLLRANSLVSSAGLVKGEIILADSNNGSIYSIITTSKTASIVTGSDNFKRQDFVDFSANNIYVANAAGIFSAKRAGDQATVGQVAKPSDKWNQISGLKFFAGNIYLLDPKSNQIWKYQGTDFGFSDLVPYLKTGISVDLSKVVDFAIDGFVYVLSQNGSIVKFSSGSVQDFTVTGLDTAFSNPTSIFVTDETKNIYILDNGNKRVVVLDKNGVYQSQYVFPQSFSGQTIVLADENVKKLFLVSGSKIYSIDLR